MGVYLRAKFKVSSIILTSFRLGEGGNFNFPPLLTHTPQNEPLKSPHRLGLSGKAILGLKYLGQILLPFKVKVKEINVSFKVILTFGI